jgi:peptidoglycan/LPS O-acetylase OafA/YrhL
MPGHQRSVDALANSRFRQEATLNKNPTILGQMEKGSGFTAGFDYVRIGLALAVLVWHSYILIPGSASLYRAAWSGPFRFLVAAILPMFFALSGFLVAGSLARTRPHEFVALRALRLIPALAVEVTLSALVLGAVFTTLPLREYLTNRELVSYLGNIVGLMHFTLPGVFEHNPAARVVNSQLWTIPFEFACYLSLVLLSLSTVLRDRRAFVALVVLLSLVATARALFFDPVSPIEHLPVGALVVSFLAGVSLYLYRDTIPCFRPLGVAAGVVAAVLLQFPNTCYLAAFPVAYLTVWLGLMRPPKIPFGDLSYGVYLFHFPIEQSVMQVFPGVGCWWQLTLIALPPSALCAWLSWNLVEHPVLARKKDILAAVDRAYAALARQLRPALTPGERAR